MHDYSDEKCVLILRHVEEAMDGDSVILIDDMVIPNRGADWRSTQLDLMLMASIAGVERTEKQWHRLVGKAGLKILEICTYTSEIRDSIIIAVPE